MVLGWLPWTTSIIEGTVLFSSWNRYLSWICTSLPCKQYFRQNYHPRLTECLVHSHSIPHSIASDQGTRFTAKCCNGAFSWNSLILSFPPQSWSSWLETVVERSFADSITIPVRWQYLAGLRQGFTEGCICSESAPDFWYRFPHRQDS